MTERKIIEWEGRKYEIVPTPGKLNISTGAEVSIFRVKQNGTLGRELWNGRAALQIMARSR